VSDVYLLAGRVASAPIAWKGFTMKPCLKIILILMSWAMLDATGWTSLEQPADAQDLGRPVVTRKAPRPPLPDAPILPKLCPALPGPVLLKLKCVTEPEEKKEEEEKKCDDPDLAPVTPAELLKVLKKGPDVKIECKPNGNGKNGDGKNGDGKKNGNGEEEEEEDEGGFDRLWSVIQQG
jgi:hypothetical protein